MDVRRIVTEASNRTEPDALRDLQVTLNGLRSDLQDLKGGGGGGKKQWADAFMRVLVAVLTAVVLGTGGLLLQLNRAVAVQTETINRIDDQTVENKTEITRLRDWRDRHVENGR